MRGRAAREGTRTRRAVEGCGGDVVWGEGSRVRGRVARNTLGRWGTGCHADVLPRQRTGSPPASVKRVSAAAMVAPLSAATVAMGEAPTAAVPQGPLSHPTGGGADGPARRPPPSEADRPAGRAPWRTGGRGCYPDPSPPPHVGGASAPAARARDRRSADAWHTRMHARAGAPARRPTTRTRMQSDGRRSSAARGALCKRWRREGRKTGSEMRHSGLVTRRPGWSDALISVGNLVHMKLLSTVIVLRRSTD